MHSVLIFSSLSSTLVLVFLPVCCHTSSFPPGPGKTGIPCRFLLPFRCTLGLSLRRAGNMLLPMPFSALFPLLNFLSHQRGPAVLPGFYRYSIFPELLVELFPFCPVLDFFAVPGHEVSHGPSEKILVDHGCYIGVVDVYCDLAGLPDPSHCCVHCDQNRLVIGSLTSYYVPCLVRLSCFRCFQAIRHAPSDCSWCLFVGFDVDFHISHSFHHFLFFVLCNAGT